MFFPLELADRWRGECALVLEKYNFSDGCTGCTISAWRLEVVHQDRFERDVKQDDEDDAQASMRKRQEIVESPVEASSGRSNSNSTADEHQNSSVVQNTDCRRQTRGHDSGGEELEFVVWAEPDWENDINQEVEKPRSMAFGAGRET